MGRLHSLVHWSKHESVKAEIERGMDINEVAGNLTPLELAIHNHDVAMVDILIRAGADVNQGHVKTGRRPLHSAATMSDLRIMDLLLDAGADVEGCRETSTPLCVAASFGKREAYDRLIQAGANPLATRNGKAAHELMASAVDPFDWMRRFGADASEKQPDRYEQAVRKMMEDYPNVEEYAANRANDIYVYGFDQGVFTDLIVEKWARDLGEILRSPERQKQCEEQFLSGEKLDRARRERRHYERRVALEEARKERIALANERFVSKKNDQ